MKKMGLISLLVWLVIGTYGLFFNLTYIDEAKYLIKGWLMITRQVGYYSTEGFFYQHMPLGLWWYGLGQKLFGPNLLVARVQAWMLGLGIYGLSFLTVKKLFNQKAGLIALGLLSLSPVVALYYSSAVPQALTAFLMMLGFLSLAYDKRYWASAWFSWLFLARENFLFSLGIYLLWLGWFYRKELWKHLLIVIGVVGALVFPGLPGILNVIKNFPGINILMPITEIEKEVLINWQQKTHTIDLYFRAIKEFGAIYLIWLVVLALIILMRKKLKLKASNKPVWQLVKIFFWFNFLAHGIAAFQLSPRSFVAYFAYLAPLAAVIAAAFLSKLKKKWVMTGYGLLLLTLPLMMLSSIFTRTNTVEQLTLFENNLTKVVEDKSKIIWLAEPTSLYLAGKVSYYPLINHTNFFKTSQETKVVKRLGFWNQDLMAEWLKEAELVVVDPNRLSLMRKSKAANQFVVWFEDQLLIEWQELEVRGLNEESRLRFYLRN